MNPLIKNFLFHRSKEYSQMKLGLDRVQKTLEKLGHPEKSYPSILIAGTNGKGSVARMVESVLRNAGYRTGLYTSPHLQRFTERICINGEEISESEIIAVLQVWQSLGVLVDEVCLVTPSGEKLTWFEQVTVLAFEIFRRRKVEIAILEVGLGGRLDATNVVDPLVSAITSISLDHTEVLGNSVFEIAREKAGVMRAEKPVVLGCMEENVRNFLVQASRIQTAQPIVPLQPKGTTKNFSYRGYQDLSLGLQGDHQLKNASVAIEILEHLKNPPMNSSSSIGATLPWDEKHLREGLLKAVNPGRLEWINSVPPILLDGAHNIEAATALVDYLKSREDKSKLVIVLGMVAEKDCVGVLKKLNSLHPHFIFTEVDSVRSLKLSQWQEICRREKIEGEFSANPLEAISAAQARTGQAGVIVVTGSLYLVGMVREVFLPINNAKKNCH